jgi:hypothetical protein
MLPSPELAFLTAWRRGRPADSTEPQVKHRHGHPLRDIAALGGCYVKLPAQRDGSLARRFRGVLTSTPAMGAFLPQQSGTGPGQRLEVVSASADRVTGHPEQREDHADHDDDDADRPENRYSGDEPDNEENDAENDQGRPLAYDSRRPGRGQKNVLDV